MTLFKTGIMLSLSLPLLAACSSDAETWGLTPQQAVARPSNETTASIPAAYSRQYDPAMAAWQKARSAYEAEAKVYWDRIADMRKMRNQKRANGQTVQLTDYVLTQPPVYNGPPRPQTDQPQTPPKRPTGSIPRMGDFVAAAQRVYGFTPDRPRDEAEFMRSYAIAAQEIGLTRDQLVAVYAFETGGNGTHDLQSGMLRPDASPISTAVGYNQLVATASVSLMWEFGDDIATELRNRAMMANSAERVRLLKKSDVVKRMTAVAKTVPHRWSEQETLSKKPEGMGIHAMTLDKDVGPLLQIHKLRTSMQFLRRKGVNRTLTGAELEMLNLTGDGNGYDMVTMPASFRDKVPTSNFFVRRGYERNPVAKTNNTVSALLRATEEKMQANMQRDGAQALYSIFGSTQFARK